MLDRFFRFHTVPDGSVTVSGNLTSGFMNLFIKCFMFLDNTGKTKNIYRNSVGKLLGRQTFNSL
jgi:hypothetical protein